MSLDTVMNLIFCMIMLNLILLAVVMITSIKALKQYKNYIDEKEIKETMDKVMKDIYPEEEIEVL
jgi:hypothetical protein